MVAPKRLQRPAISSMQRSRSESSEASSSSSSSAPVESDELPIAPAFFVSTNSTGFCCVVSSTVGAAVAVVVVVEGEEGEVGGAQSILNLDGEAGAGAGAGAGTDAGEATGGACTGAGTGGCFAFHCAYSSAVRPTSPFVNCIV